MHEPRRRFALSGQHLSAPAERGTRTAQACSSLTGGEFFAEIQRGVALCGAREIAASAAGTAPYPRRLAKRKGHLRFPFLFELLPFPCFLIWRRFPICDRSEKEYGSRVTTACLSPPFRSSQTAYCYTCGLINAECGITVPHNSLARYIDSTCEDKLYQTPKFAGAVRYNVPRICATRVCRACADLTVCVAVRCL